MVLISATCFGTLSILAKYAYAAGLGAEQALAFRFGLAAVGMIDSGPALPASAVIIRGAAVAFCLLATLNNQLALPPSAAGWAVAIGLAVVPTMLAISLFLAGLPRVGAARAALLSTWEPVVTVVLAVLLLGDRMSPIQALGGILLVAAVILVQAAHLWRPGLLNALK